MPVMITLTYSAAFITFFSVIGPPKVLLAFAGLAQHHPIKDLRAIALISSAGAVVIGVATGLTSPWLLELFHSPCPGGTPPARGSGHQCVGAAVHTGRDADLARLDDPVRSAGLGE